MTIQDFMLQAQSAVSDHMKQARGMTVDIAQEEIIKANDCRVYGLRMTPEGANAGWTVYLNDLYARYEGGEDLAALMAEAAGRCEDGLSFGAPVSPEDLRLDFDSIRDRLSVRLLGVMNNLSYMAGRPYIDAGCGLALIAVIGCDSTPRNEWFLSVTDELLACEIGCSREELLTAALENTVKTEPPLLVSLADYIFAGYVSSAGAVNYLEQPDMDPRKLMGAFMLTNSSTFFGAAVLFYPGMLERIAEIFGCGYYVLPSSVHEVMLVPDAAEPDVAGMAETVREANSTVVDRTDLLSDSVMHYDPAEGRLSTVRIEL